MCTRLYILVVSILFSNKFLRYIDTKQNLNILKTLSISVIMTILKNKIIDTLNNMIQYSDNQLCFIHWEAKAAVLERVKEFDY